MGQTINGLIKAAIYLGIAAIVFSMVAQEYFVDVYVVPHNGMAPTLIKGDEVVAWRGAEAEMADVMVCEHPSRDELIFGRALVFPGHQIRTDHLGGLWIDGDRPTVEFEGRVRFYDEDRKRLYEMNRGMINYAGHNDHEFFTEVGSKLHLMPYRVGSGVYLLGDNRTYPSKDSRAFGEVNPASCLGQVIFRLKAGPDRDDDLDGRLPGFIR